MHRTENYCFSQQTHIHSLVKEINFYEKSERKGDFFNKNLLIGYFS